MSAAAGFSDYSIPTYKQSDKALHFIAFFLLTLTFYWILETSRRKVLQLTFIVCTIGLGAASEIVQGLLPVGPKFHSFSNGDAVYALEKLSRNAMSWRVSKTERHFKHSLGNELTQSRSIVTLITMISSRMC